MVVVDGAKALVSSNWRWWFRSDVGLVSVEGPLGRQE